MNIYDVSYTNGTSVVSSITFSDSLTNAIKETSKKLGIHRDPSDRPVYGAVGWRYLSAEIKSFYE